MVNVSIMRAGQEEPLTFDIIRARIPQESVRYAHMIRPGVGYVRIVRFATATGRELEEALSELREQGMEKTDRGSEAQLGGSAPAGSRGLQPLHLERRAHRPTPRAGHRPRTPSTSPMRRGTSTSPSHSSCSSITGRPRPPRSSRERCRTSIAVWWSGPTSFGKGLVQNQMRLRDGSALLLTVAKYYHAERAAHSAQLRGRRDLSVRGLGAGLRAGQHTRHTPQVHHRERTHGLRRRWDHPGCDHSEYADHEQGR